MNVRVGVSWLPFYHDMGLFFALLVPFGKADRMHYISPVSFLRNPAAWLQLIADHGGNYTASPDFGFALVTRKWGNRPSINLSSLISMVSGAEPIRDSTISAFESKFGPMGLPERWLRPSYGLAESVVFVSVGPGTGCKQPVPKVFGKASFALYDLGDALLAKHGISIAIVDPDTCKRVPSGEQGEIWVSSPSVAGGYWNKPELSNEVFRASIKDEEGKTWLRSGDKGVLVDNKLHFCGRIKDLVIIHGR